MPVKMVFYSRIFIQSPYNPSGLSIFLLRLGSLILPGVKTLHMQHPRTQGGSGEGVRWGSDGPQSSLAQRARARQHAAALWRMIAAQAPLRGGGGPEQHSQGGARPSGGTAPRRWRWHQRRVPWQYSGPIWLPSLPSCHLCCYGSFIKGYLVSHLPSLWPTAFFQTPYNNLTLLLLLLLMNPYDRLKIINLKAGNYSKITVIFISLHFTKLITLFISLHKITYKLNMPQLCSIIHLEQR